MIKDYKWKKECDINHKKYKILFTYTFNIFNVFSDNNLY